MSIHKLYTVQMGLESVFGTEVNATTILRGDKATIATNDEIIRPDEGVGRARGVGRYLVTKREASIDIPEAPATTEQLPHFFDSFFGTATPTQDGAGSDYIYTYTIWDSGAFPTNDTFTLEGGDEQQYYLVTGAIVDTLTISGESGSPLNRAVTMIGQNRGTTTATGGLSVPAVTKLLFGNCTLYVDDVGTGFGNTAISGLRNVEVTFEKIAEHKYDGLYVTTPANGVYSNRIGPADGYAITITWTQIHNAASVTEYTNYLNETPRAVRLECTGTAVTTPGTTYSNRLFRVDLPGTYDPVGDFPENDNGESTRTFTLINHYDSTLATAGTVTIVNELSVLP